MATISKAEKVIHSVIPAVVTTSKTQNAILDDLQKENDRLRKMELEKTRELIKQKSANVQEITSTEPVKEIEHARKVQSEYDRRISIARGNTITTISGKVVEKPAIISGAPGLAEAGMAHLVNLERVRQDKPAFKEYAEYLDFEGKTENDPAPTLKITRVSDTPKVDPLTPLKDLTTSIGSKMAGGVVYHIASQDYYLGWNKSRCYLQSVKNDEVNILVKSEHVYGESAVMQIIPFGKSVRDLTKAEVDDIIKGKPSYTDLLKVYSRFYNWDQVYLDTKNIIPVW